MSYFLRSQQTVINNKVKHNLIRKG